MTKKSESFKLPSETLNKVRKYILKQNPKPTISGVIVAAIDKYLTKNK